MKKFLILLCIGSLSLAAITAQTRSFKRGVGYNNLMTEDVEALSPGLSWGYNWGHSGSSNDAAFNTYNIEFVPMAWNGLNKTTIRNLLNNHPEIKYILGFNEPNFKDQANLSPTVAASRWKDIEEIADEYGLTIVGPAVNYSPDAPYQDPVKWYDEFFAACPDCRVDHIAIHLYMSSATAIKSNIEKFKKYGKPIWLTEFCAWDDNTTASSQLRFLFTTIDYLETDPDVYRYAWFKERGWAGAHPYMQLLSQRQEGELLPLGKVFTYMSSYDNDFYHTTEQEIPAEQYISMKGIMVEPTADISGNLNILDFDPTYDFVEYNVDIAEAGEYNIVFRYVDQYGDASEVIVSVNNDEKASMLFENKGIDVWSTQSCTGYFDAGKQKIKIHFKRGGLKINWWKLTKETSSGVFSYDDDSKISVYPNPAQEFVRVSITSNTKAVNISTIEGKQIMTYPITDASDRVIQLPLKGMKQGVYLININDENQQISKHVKLIIK